MKYDFGAILAQLTKYRNHVDFANYNPTEFFIKRDGSVITIRYKHEKEYDMFKNTTENTLCVPGHMGGLAMTMFGLGEEIKACTSFRDNETIIEIDFQNMLDKDKKVGETLYLFDSLEQIADPEVIVKNYYELGMLDDDDCLTTCENIVNIVEGTEPQGDLGASEKIAMFLTEVISNCVMYQHNEEKILAAHYPDDSILFYKISDDEEVTELSESEIDMFFEDLKNGVDFKNNHIRRDHERDQVARF